jgi:hypothetical protein
VDFASKLQTLIDEELSIDVADKITRAQILHDEETKKKLDAGIQVDTSAGRKIKDAVKKTSVVEGYTDGAEFDSDDEKRKFGGISSLMALN